MKVEEIAALIADEKQKAAFLEAMKNEYIPKADFTKHTQTQAEELTKAKAENDQFRKWYQDQYVPYIKVAEPIVQAHYARQNGNPNPGNPEASLRPTEQNNWYQNWDMLSGQQQAQLLEERNRKVLMDALLEKERGYQDVLGQWGKSLGDQMQNQFAVFVEAQNRKAQDPDLDVLSYMKRVSDLSPAKGNPFDMAYQMETYERDKKKWLDEGRKLGKQDAETEFKSKQGNIPLTTPPSVLTPYKKPEVKLPDRMTELTNKVTEKYGPGVWQP